MNLKDILNKDDEFDKEELLYIVNNTNNKADYVLLNHIEKKLIEIQGKDFLQKSHNKIQYIMGLILECDLDRLYEFYDGSFYEYMKICNHDYNQIGSFNLTFAILIHVAIKIIRRYS